MTCHSEKNNLRIITSHDFPPIPVRNVDFSAHIDGREEEGPYGRGPTEYAACVALLHELVGSECRLEEFVTGLEKVMQFELAEAEMDGRNTVYTKGYKAAMRTVVGFV